jgi:hypothetical protein
MAVELNIGLSEEEKRDLERMIGDFQKERIQITPHHDIDSLQKQIATMNKRLEYLTKMFLAIDRRMKPLFETVQLTYQKSELLNQRINAVIDTLRTGARIK